MVYHWPLEKLIEESGNINKKNLQIRIKETLPWYVFLVGYLKNCYFETVQDCYGWIEEIFRELGKDKFNVFVSYTQDEKEIGKGYVYRNRMRLADIKWKDIKNAMFFSFSTGIPMENLCVRFLPVFSALPVPFQAWTGA